MTSKMKNGLSKGQVSVILLAEYKNYTLLFYIKNILILQYNSSLPDKVKELIFPQGNHDSIRMEYYSFQKIVTFF